MARKKFEPTDAQRREVETFAAFGIPQTDMLALIINPETGRPIDEKTLRQVFRAELDVGMTRANVEVARSLYAQAVGAPAEYDNETGMQLRAEQPRVISAAIFWAKARMGWKESSALELTGKNGGPIEVDDARSRLADLLARKAAAEGSDENS